jgi:opacity protein-like surface antigen
MKRIFFFFALSVLLHSGLSAQSITLGLRAGLGRAQLSNYNDTKNDVWGADLVRSQVYGATLQVPFNRWLSVQAEANHITKGNIRYGLENRYDYWHFPLMARFDASPANAWRVFGQAGLYWAALRQQAQRYTGKGGYAQIYLVEYGPVTRTDIGFCAGTGVAYALTPRLWMELECRADLGQTDVLNLPEQYPGKPPRNVSAWGMLGLKYQLR